MKRYTLKTKETVAKTTPQTEPCRLKFGLQWRTMSGERAFMWSAMQTCKGWMAEGVIYDEQTGRWGRSIGSDEGWVLAHVIDGPPPHLKELEKALVKEMGFKLEGL